MTIPETIAKLDVLENELENIKGKIRLLRHDLFEIYTADNREEYS